MSRFIVMSASAHMPSSCRGNYRRVAVVETDLPAPLEPARIDRRARGVVRLVDTWEGLNVGSTNRCAFQRAVAEAETLASRLNAEAAIAAKAEERKLKRRIRAHARRMLTKLAEETRA